MPLKKTVYRGKHAIKTLIITGIVGLLGIALAIVMGMMNGNNVMTPFFVFALVLFGVDMFFGAFFVFVARKNKILYLISMITAFVACEAIGLVGWLIHNFIMIHIGWMLPAMLFFYILAEIYEDGTINARIFGPIAALVLGALLLIWKDIETVYFIQVIGVILFAGLGILMIVYFIIWLVSFIKKNKADELTLGSAKFAYDVPTNDEAALDSRASSTEFKELKVIPKIYDGGVWRISDLGIKNIATYIHNYIAECIDTINYMLSLAKDRIETVDDYNDFVKQYNKWIDNLNEDQDKMVDFLQVIARCTFLEIDYGSTIEFDFCKYEIKREASEDEDNFYVRISGFSRTFYHPKALFGKDKVEFSVPNSYWSIVHVGHHNQEVDSQAKEHGYHYPGTPMPEED